MSLKEIEFSVEDSRRLQRILSVSYLPKILRVVRTHRSTLLLLSLLQAVMAALLISALAVRLL
jgi:hypothetical protein